MELFFISLLLGALGFAAGILGGVIGFGTTIILIPPLVYFFGPFQTIPIVAIVATVANLSRVLLWWREIDWRVTFAYSAMAIPGVILGANTLVSLNARLIEMILGAFLILLIPIRRWMRKQKMAVALWQMGLVGLGIGFLTGIVATTGAINTPFFLAYGLSKGAFLGTEAASSLSLFFTKGLVFHRLGVINLTSIYQGLLIGACVFVGSLVSKRIVLSLPEKRFMQLMELVMLTSGILVLLMAFWG
jgi:hypothetical protein